jgi:hypothetical protein
MKISYLLIAILLANFTILKAQNLPIQVQKSLNSLENHQQKFAGVASRNNTPDCIADTIKNYKYLSPNDSILESYNVIELSSDVNGYTNIGYSINQSTGNIYISTNYIVEFNDQNKEIFTEFIVFNETGTALYGNKGLTFYNPISLKVDSTIALIRNLNTQTWDNSRKTVYIYYSDGLVLSNQTSIWNGNQ